MAHHKRRRARTQSPTLRGSIKAWRARHGLDPNGREWGYKSPMHGWPAWWDRMCHTRPTRAANHRAERAIKAGGDADAMPYPLPKKPHKYFW